MSGCLIFQRPDICSTTSLESIRTSRSASGGVLVVELEAGDQPVVLGDVVGRDADDSARSAITSPVSRVEQHRAVRRVAGVATRAAVGLDPDRRVGPSEAGLRGAHQDAAALLAAHHLVGRASAIDAEVGGGQLESAAAATSLTQRGCADAVLLSRGSSRRASSGPAGSSRR